MNYARDVLRLGEKLRISLDEHRLGVRGYVRVSASSSVLVQRLARDLSVFVRDNPEIRLDLQEQPSKLTMAAALNKKVDIGIIVRDSPADGLRVIDYSGDRLAITARSGPPAARSLVPSRSALYERGGGCITSGRSRALKTGCALSPSISTAE
jgi:DNA-binding transcriptional LysR family regulator